MRAVDTSRLSRGEPIAAIGGVVLIVSLFLNWSESFLGNVSAWDAFSGIDFVMLLAGLVALAFGLATAVGVAERLPTGSALIVSLLGIIVVGWSLGWDLEDPDAGIGAWLGLIAGAAIAYGGHRANGGPLVPWVRPGASGPMPPPPA